MKYKIGDQFKFKESSTIIGTIYEIEDKIYRVRWDNGYKIAYSHSVIKHFKFIKKDITDLLLRR